MKTIQIALGALLLAVLSTADLQAQCTDIGGGCGPRLACVGQPNIGCPNFALVGQGLHPNSPFAFLAFGDISMPGVPIPVPAACQQGCIWFFGNNFFAIPAPISPFLGFNFPLPVPQDPALVGITFGAQAGQLMRVGGGFFPCLVLSNALEIRIGRGGC